MPSRDRLGNPFADSPFRRDLLLSLSRCGFRRREHRPSSAADSVGHMSIVTENGIHHPIKSLNVAPRQTEYLRHMCWGGKWRSNNCLWHTLDLTLTRLFSSMSKLNIELGFFTGRRTSASVSG